MRDFWTVFKMHKVHILVLWWQGQCHIHSVTAMYIFHTISMPAVLLPWCAANICYCDITFLVRQR